MRTTAAEMCRLLLFLWLSCAVPSESLAQAAELPQPKPNAGFAYERGGLMGVGLVAGIKLGAAFSQPFSDLGGSFMTELELGFTLPVLARAIELFVSGAYLEPRASGAALSDPRVSNDASYHIAQQETVLGFGVRYRVPIAFPVRPYVALGPRYYFVRSLLEGDAQVADALGGSSGDDAALGVFGAVGAELHLGRGALALETSIAWAKLNTQLLPHTSAGALGLTLGYRLFL